MAQVNKLPEKLSKTDAAADSRALLRRAFKGTLATIDRGNSYPYASLITLATDSAGAPAFLISNLARHTANLTKDPRASIMVDATGALADPLQGARLTVFGRAEKVTGESVRRRFLARHPEAQFYADFSDFAFWRLQIEGAHYIGGFGRIFDFEPGELLVPLDGAEVLIEAEPGIVAHMNEDHASALELYATVMAGTSPGAWRMTGIDPEGCDLVLGQEARRIVFGERISNPTEARKALVRLAGEARKPKP
jgi:heme iron utilization protein